MPPYNTARELTRLGHKVCWLISSPSSDFDIDLDKALVHIEELPRYCKKITSHIPFARTFISLLLCMINLYKHIVKFCISSKVDIIHADRIWAAFPSILARYMVKKPVVFVSQCVEYELACHSSKNKLYRIFTLFLERFCIDKCDFYVIGSQRELDVIRGLYGDDKAEKAVIIPQDVATEKYVRKNGNDGLKKRLGFSGKKIVIFHGNFTYFPNKDALELIVKHIAPRVTKEVPEAAFVLIGEIPAQEISRYKDVTFTGYVDRDTLMRFLMAADVAIVPLRFGSGPKSKVREYLAAGLPVVSTPKGVEGIDVIDGVHVLIAHSLSDFCDKIVLLLKNEELSKKLSSEAQKLMLEKYSSSKTVYRYLEIYQKALERYG